MIYKILLVGAGNIGIRHLQGLLTSSLKLNITVVDTSEISIKKAQSILKEKIIAKNSLQIDWKREIPKDVKFFDLAIISTSSKSRGNLIHNINKVAIINYWLIEKVLAQSKFELNLIKIETSKSKGVWINTPRRMMSMYQTLKSKFSDKNILRFKMIGGLWGMACNAIHFIDLVSWWTNESLSSIDTSKVNKEWIKSKRLGYFEITGDLIVKFSLGTELILRSHPVKKENIIEVEFNDREFLYINESKNIFTHNMNNVSCKNFELQSQMTGPLVTKILKDGKCNLPELKQSIEHHEVLLDVLLDHWNNSNNLEDKKVPIT